MLAPGGDGSQPNRRVRPALGDRCIVGKSPNGLAADWALGIDRPVGHTAASLMIRQGGSVKAVQRQLGHATASITLDIYGHLFPDELDALATRLEDARADALASLAGMQQGPSIVRLRYGAAADRSTVPEDGHEPRLDA